MPEAITKYAINSTLGTEDFEPLDVMMMSQKTMVASDNLLYDVLTSSITSNSSYPKREKNLFKVKSGGSFKLKFNANGYGDTSGKVSIYRNNETTPIQTVTFTTPNQYVDYLSNIISANRGDSFKIILEHMRTDATTIARVSICANLVDGSIIKLL